MYLVILNTGQYDDAHSSPVFVTYNKDKAEQYERRFSNLIKRQEENIKRYKQNKDDRYFDLFWFSFIEYRTPFITVEEVEKR